MAMAETRLGKWFERKYLEYQLQHGLMTLKDFAELLDISRSYLSLILSGERSEISEHVALNIAEVLDDYSLLNILGYKRPPATKLPPGLKASLDAAVDEISRKYTELGITDFSSDEALEIATTILESHGFKHTTSVG